MGKQKDETADPTPSHLGPLLPLKARRGVTSNKLVLYTKISKGPAGFWNHKRASKIFGAVWERNLRSRSLSQCCANGNFLGKEGGWRSSYRRGSRARGLVVLAVAPVQETCGATVPISGDRQCKVNVGTGITV